MGVVYEAVRESLRNHVALKVMHPQYRNRPDYLRRFHTEARSAARLHHTNIVSVFDYGEHDGVCYYAMQYIAGQSLDKVLDDIRQLRRENEEIPVGETVRLTCHESSGCERDDLSAEDSVPMRAEIHERIDHAGAPDRPVCDGQRRRELRRARNSASFRDCRLVRGRRGEDGQRRRVASCRIYARPKQIPVSRKGVPRHREPPPIPR